jgi:hypothetical protein
MVPGLFGAGTLATKEKSFNTLDPSSLNSLAIVGAGYSEKISANFGETPKFSSLT